MADEHKTNLNEDEFHFTEAEEVSPYSVPRDSGIASRINRRNIIIAIIVIIIAFALYKLIGMFWGGPATKKVAPTVTTTEQTSTPQATLQIQTPPPASAPAVPADVQAQLTQMEQNNADNKQQISNLSGDISTLTNTVNSMQSTLQTMNQQLQTITTQFQQQQADINALKEKPKVVHKIPHRKIVIRRVVPVWHIRALVPGRAWLMLPDGSSMTVAVGDKLPNYGRITSINVPKGIVKTSTGAIIQYMNNNN